MNGKKISTAIIWKLIERFGVQSGQFVLQLILARILDPAHYGVLAIMIIFTNLANVFIQTGFNTALIQNKDVTDEDYSSVFWVTLGIACVMYGIIFFCAPLIGYFYEMPNIVLPLRILALMLLPGALNSVQLAKISRDMNFRKVFTSNLAGILIAGITGIVIAKLGGGLWALVTQTLLNIVIVCAVMTFSSGLKLRFVCNGKRVSVLFRFGWKMLLSGLIDTFYQELRSLVIGKKYNSSTLAYYNRGKNFPQFITTAVNGTVQSVMLPAMASEQDDRAKVKFLMRKSITLSSYIIFPLMAGLAGVATPMVRLLLTEKWLPCVPYLQIYCFTLAFYPVHSCNLQAINAMGRSGIFLILEIIKKAVGISALIVAVFCFDSPIAIALTGAFTGLISFFINAYPNNKLVGYSYFEQLRDIAPSFLLSLVMMCLVWVVQLLGWNDLITLLLQVIVGIGSYILLSFIFRLAPFHMLLNLLKTFLKRK